MIELDEKVTSEMNKNSVWLDGIIGVATGDALGLPVQF